MPFANHRTTLPTLEDWGGLEEGREDGSMRGTLHGVSASPSQGAQDAQDETGHTYLPYLSGRSPTAGRIRTAQLLQTSSMANLKLFLFIVMTARTCMGQGGLPSCALNFEDFYRHLSNHYRHHPSLV